MLRIVVIDDNRDAADSIAMLLELEGHSARAGVTGAEGVALARELRPHVVLVDIGLPDMDGYEVAARLRADAATVDATLVALTGFGREADRLRSRTAGFDMHFTKPVDPDDLLAYLATVRPPAG